MQIANDKQCEHAKTGKVQEDFPVTGAPGFALRVSREGRKTWTLRYRTGHGDQRRLKLGTYPELSLKAARDRARQSLVAVSRGEDPARQKREQRDDATFCDLFNHWYETHAVPKLARPTDELHRYRRHLENSLGNEIAKNLTRRKVQALAESLTKNSGPIQSNRVLELINRVLNHALDAELITANPAIRVRKNTEKPRERVLGDDELACLWRELERLEAWKPEPGKGARGKSPSKPLIRAVRVLLLTGQRRGEVVGAELSELRLAAEPPVWELPGSRTKNGLLHRVPLPPMAACEFRRAAAETGSLRFLFPPPGNEGAHIKAASITTAFQKMCKSIGIKDAAPHDLRRTVGTGMARLRVPPHIRALVLNHAKKASDVTTALYDRHGYDDEKLEALALWEGHVRKVVGVG
jgi:integrase